MIPLKTAIADDDRYICQQIQECLMQYSTQKDIDIDLYGLRHALQDRLHPKTL